MAIQHFDMFVLRARVLGALVARSFILAARAGAQDSTVAVRSLPPSRFTAFFRSITASGDPMTKDGFRLRKADLKFSGDLSPHLQWRITFDAAKVSDAQHDDRQKSATRSPSATCRSISDRASCRTPR